jgi:hypothetical protein
VDETGDAERKQNQCAKDQSTHAGEPGRTHRHSPFQLVLSTAPGGFEKEYTGEFVRYWLYFMRVARHDTRFVMAKRNLPRSSAGLFRHDRIKE